MGVILLTSDIYLDIFEVIIIGITSISISLFIGDKTENQMISTFVGFLTFWILSVFDIIIDHFIYYYPISYDDGRSLFLFEKIHEFSDDLRNLSLILVGIIIILNGLLLKFKKVGQMKNNNE